MNNEKDNEITEYASIDKPWVKYYVKNTLQKENLKRTVYQEIVSANKDYTAENALEFFKTKINFGKMIDNINLTAKAFSEYGVKKGNFVTIISAGIPETVYSFYGISKIGAVANMMAYYFEESELVSRLEDYESDLLIVMDQFYPYIKDSIAKSRIKNVVIIPTLNSSILGLFSKKCKLERSNELYWNQFIKDAKNTKEVDEVSYEKDTPLAMVYSSGTTGAAKGILLSNDSFQNSLNAYKELGINIKRGYKFYQIIPPWYSTGLSTSIHLPLSCGSTVFMDPRFERDIFVKNIVKEKTNIMVAPTSMYEGFLQEKLNKNADLSHIVYAFEGGEPLRKKVSDGVENVFKKHGSDAKLLVGFGQCECGATITSDTPYTTHVDGGVGIPLPGINIAIVDNLKNLLPNNTTGEILVDTSCGMLCYYKNQSATDKYFYYDNNGKKWSCTGDLGYINDDGILIFKGRKSDFSIVNDKMVYNFDIEEAIYEDENVKLCDVITNDDLLTAHIVFNDNVKCEDENFIFQELEYIQSLIYEKIQDKDFVPINFKIRQSFPSAKSGKRDIKAMKEEKDGFIKINTYIPKTKKLQLK